MFSFFERLVEPFPQDMPEQPPEGLVAFCRYYSKGMWPAIFAVSILAAAIAMLEVSLFGFVGQLVDWLASKDPDTFLAQEKSSLIWMGAVVLVILPSCVALQSLINHQTLMGNYPMRIRWQAHRYLIGQSISFFQNEFAGRIATKVMQTALSVRQSVMQLLNLLVYISVYFISIVVMVFSIDWRLSLPLLLWLCIYIGVLRYFVPRLKRVAQRQADARSVMTGRIVDSYSNIATVKLFSHTSREADYAYDGMNGFLQTVHPQMRLVTLLNTCVWFSNALLVFSISALAIYLWLEKVVTPGDIAIAITLCLRLNGMSQWIMWEVSSLFENIGTVQDGINTLSKPTAVKDIDNAPPLIVSGGAITFSDVTFNYPGLKCHI